MDKCLMKGSEAIAAAAIQAGCRFYFGYPITPQTELLEYMARELPKAGGEFVQAESETAAISMVYGAAAAGGRVMISSSSPGIALMQEGISYLAAAELPCVIVNFSRGGPGLGNVSPSQADYFQNTRGGGNGDYRLPVYAPENIQEAADLMMEVFDIADLYRTPVLVCGDGMLSQMKESVGFKEPVPKILPAKDWALVGTKGKRERNVIVTLQMDAQALERHNIHLKEKYDLIEKSEIRYELYNMKNQPLVAVAYGTTARIVKSAIELLKEEDLEVGLIRPITLWPFPVQAFQQIPASVKALLAVEMSMGQMIDDVRIANNGRFPVHFFGRSGGMVPTQREVADKIKELLSGGELS